MFLYRLIDDVMLLDIYRPKSLSPEQLLEGQEVTAWRPRKRVHHITRMREPQVLAVLPPLRLQVSHFTNFSGFNPQGNTKVKPYIYIYFIENATHNFLMFLGLK